MKVGYLGPKASFSHVAAENVFGDEELIPVGSIMKLFDKVENCELEKIIVPIENTSGGSVAVTLDELLEKDFFINGEYFLDINYCFLTNNKEKVNKIYSHPQGFLQCKKWIKENYSNVELIECASNSEAAKIAATENQSALATKNCSTEYDLEIASEKVNGNGTHVTRFIIVSKNELDSKGKEKTSCFIALKNKPGALFDSLLPLKENEINMTKIESRPSKESSWEYVFFVELTANLSEDKLVSALNEIKNYTANIKLLGSYSKL